MNSLLLVLALQIVSQVAAETKSQLANDVQRLVQQLDDRDRQVRTDAEKKLMELGAAALPYLPAIDPSTPAEVKERLTRVRATLELQLAQQAAQETRISIIGSKSLAELSTAIKEQTGNELVDFRDRFGQEGDSVKIDVNFADAPFWQSVDTALDQLGLTVYTFGGEPRKLAVVAKPEGERPRIGHACYVGPFRIEPTEILAHRNLRAPATKNLQLKLEVLWEPRLLPILARQPYSNIEVTADNGQRLSLPAEGSSEIPVQSTVSGVEIALPIDVPDRSVQKITSLKGTLYMLIPGHETEFTFDKLADAKGISQKRAGVVVVLDRVIKNRSLYEFRVKLRLEDAAQSLQSHLDWVANNEAFLIAEDGTQVDNLSYERYLEREEEIGFAYRFRVTDIAKYRFIYKTPAAIIDMPVAYELKDIELP